MIASNLAQHERDKLRSFNAPYYNYQLPAAKARSFLVTPAPIFKHFSRPRQVSNSQRTISPTATFKFIAEKAANREKCARPDAV